MSGAGRGFGGGYTETGLFSPGFQHPQSPLGPSRPLQEVEQLFCPSDQGCLGPQEPNGGFVSLGSQPIMFFGRLESGLSLCDRETEAQKGLLKIAKPGTQLTCLGAPFLFPVPSHSIVCSLILIELIKRAEPCGR